jgi:hypothetical protein
MGSFCEDNRWQFQTAQERKPRKVPAVAGCTMSPARILRPDIGENYSVAISPSQKRAHRVRIWSTKATKTGTHANELYHYLHLLERRLAAL